MAIVNRAPNVDANRSAAMVHMHGDIQRLLQHNSEVAF